MTTRYSKERYSKMPYELCARLRTAREEAGMTVGEVAEKLGYAPSTITHYENGQRNMNWDMSYKLAELYGVTVSWLVEGIPISPEQLKTIRRMAVTLYKAGPLVDVVIDMMKVLDGITGVEHSDAP